jgi:hypothetical protein
MKSLQEYINEGLLDIFSGDGCKNLETVCSAFAKRLEKVSPIKYKHKFDIVDGKISEMTLKYSEALSLQYISADDDLVIDRRGKRTIKEEARRIAKQFENSEYESERKYWGTEENCFKHLTKYLYKTGDLNAFGNEGKDSTTAIFTFGIPYLEPQEGEKDLYDLKKYYYTTSAVCKTAGKDDKETAIHLLNTAFYRLYKGLTDPEDKLREFTDSTKTTFKDIRKLIPAELINAVKAATKRKDLK